MPQVNRHKGPQLFMCDSKTSLCSPCANCCQPARAQATSCCSVASCARMSFQASSIHKFFGCHVKRVPFPHEFGQSASWIPLESSFFLPKTSSCEALSRKTACLSLSPARPATLSACRMVDSQPSYLCLIKSCFVARTRLATSPLPMYLKAPLAYTPPAPTDEDTCNADLFTAKGQQCKS